MKKASYILLVVVVFVCTACSGKPSILLHNGTRFGMTRDEVMKKEQESGMPEISRKTADPMSCEWEGGEYCIEYLQNGEETHVNLAGIPGSNIEYVFFKGKLFRLTYYLIGGTQYDEDFATVEKNLLEKYGETKYSSDTSDSLPSISVEAYSPPNYDEGRMDRELVPFPSFRSNYEECKDKFDIYETEERVLFSQRLVAQSDGTTALIEHYLGCWKIYYTWNQQLKSEPTYYHRVVYTQLSKKEVKRIKDLQKQASDDL